MSNEMERFSTLFRVAFGEGRRALASYLQAHTCFSTLFRVAFGEGHVPETRGFRKYRVSVPSFGSRSVKAIGTPIINSENRVSVPSFGSRSVKGVTAVYRPDHLGVFQYPLSGRVR